MDKIKEIKKLHKEASEIHSQMGTIYTQMQKLKFTNPNDNDERIKILAHDYKELIKDHTQIQRKIRFLKFQLKSTKKNGKLTFGLDWGKN